MVRAVLAAAAAAALTSVPLAARAGGVVEVSAGTTARLELRPLERTPTSVMIAPGFAFPVPFTLRLELGVGATLADVRTMDGRRADVDLELRPMLVVKPPLLPLYLRGLAGASPLGSRTPRLFYGGALGLSVGESVGVFFEAGLVSRELEPAAGAATTTRAWFGEGRVGVWFG